METVIHDFDLVEDAIRELRKQTEIRARAEALALWLPKLGTVAIGIGLGVALALAGLAFAREAGLEPTEVKDEHFPKFPKSDDLRPAPVNPNKENTVTDFVIFKKVEAAQGQVETGWHYANENQIRPDRQWCHLVTFGADGMGRIMPYEKLSKGLRDKCRWYQGVVEND